MRDFDDYDDDRADPELAADGDPEAYLMRLEEEEDEERRKPKMTGALMKRVQATLAEFPENERAMFLMVFSEGVSIAEAARVCGVRGTASAKFNRMLALVRENVK